MQFRVLISVESRVGVSLVPVWGLVPGLVQAFSSGCGVGFSLDIFLVEGVVCGAVQGSIQGQFGV